MRRIASVIVQTACHPLRPTPAAMFRAQGERRDDPHEDLKTPGTLSGRHGEYSADSVERRLAKDAAGLRPPNPRTKRVYVAIEGATLNRFTGVSGEVLCRIADEADVDNRCVACQLPHDPKNAACWGASKAGPAPPVLTSSPGHLFDLATTRYIGRFEFEINQSWPRSRFTKGIISVRR